MAEVPNVRNVELSLQVFPPSGNIDHYRTPVGVIYHIDTTPLSVRARIALSEAGNHSGLFGSLIRCGEYRPEPGDDLFRTPINAPDETRWGYFRSYCMPTGYVIGHEMVLGDSAAEVAGQVELAIRGLVWATEQFHRLEGDTRITLGGANLAHITDIGRGKYRGSRVPKNHSV